MIKLRKITKAIILVVILLLPMLSSSIADQQPWDCPECGRTGNTGKYCGGCGHSAPNQIEAPAQKQAVIPIAGINILSQFDEIKNRTRKWNEWDKASAPQSVDQFPMLPAFVLPLYEEVSKIDFKIEQQDNTYTIYSNIAELFPEDQYEISILCEDQQIRNNGEWIKPTTVNSDSVSFVAPEGFSFSLMEYRISYFTNNSTEQLIVDLSLDYHSVYLLFNDYSGFEITYQTNSFMQKELNELLSINIMDGGQQITFQYDLTGQLINFTKW